MAPNSVEPSAFEGETQVESNPTIFFLTTARKHDRNNQFPSGGKNVATAVLDCGMRIRRIRAGLSCEGAGHRYRFLRCIVPGAKVTLRNNGTGIATVREVGSKRRLSLSTTSNREPIRCPRNCRDSLSGP